MLSYQGRPNFKLNFGKFKILAFIDENFSLWKYILAFFCTSKVEGQKKGKRRSFPKWKDQNEVW